VLRIEGLTGKRLRWSRESVRVAGMVLTGGVGEWLTESAKFEGDGQMGELDCPKLAQGV